MDFRHRVPRPPLDACVDVIWVYRNDPSARTLERILPTGAAQLIVNLKEDETRLYDPERPSQYVTNVGTILAGVRAGYQVIDTAEQEFVAGVAFRAGGSAMFTDVPATETRDVDVPLECLWSRQRAVDLRDQLLEARCLDGQLDIMERALRATLRSSRTHPAIAFALKTFDRVPVATSIGTVTDAVGMSAKRFIEQFKVHVGVTPKRYCRIRRFQQVVARVHRGRHVDWLRVALDCGYFDQAHFIHEFRSFSGLTPTAYQSAKTPFQNHVKFLQSEPAGI
jgi:AraC-like DNA-binding protein